MAWSKVIKLSHPKVSHSLGVLALIASVTINHAASALTADLAKKCREMMVEAYPPQPAGRSTGSAQQERSYFRACVAQGGKMDNPETPTEGRGGK
jgi:hypothetical protein